MAAGPIGQIRGYNDPQDELATIRNRRIGIEIEIGEIRQLQNVLILTSLH